MRPPSLLYALLLALGSTSLGLADTAKIVVKRRTDATEEDLRKQLLKMPDVGLSQTTAAVLYKNVEEHVKNKAEIRPDAGGLFYSQAISKQGFSALPWLRGEDATKSREESQAMHVLSVQLRESMMKATPSGDVRPDAAKVKGSLTAAEWKKPIAIPTLVQLLQAENTPLRELLVELLTDIDGKEASTALAQRALFDLSPAIREKAVQALGKRPTAQYQAMLMEGLRYPWAPVADHASEAIAALDFAVYIPELINLLKEPDPKIVLKGEKKTPHLRGVIRVNHMSNCMLCHAPSYSKDELVRGRIPSPGEDPPPLYYRERSGSFVRASITYLRQDFSVMQIVPDPGKWPGHQRYDYIAWMRPATKAELSNPQLANWTPRTDVDDGGTKSELKTPGGKYPQQDALLFALRQLTKSDAGSTYEQWSKLLKGAK